MNTENYITNIKSEQLKVFPISHSREGNIGFYKRNSTELNLETDPSLENTTEEYIITKCEKITSSVYNSYLKLQPYYTQVIDQVITYPQSYNGRALTEKNLSSIIRKLANRDCYVINSSLDKSTSPDTPYSSSAFIEFMLAGRYFNLNLENITKGNLWVGINLIDKGGAFEMLNIVDTVFTPTKSTTENDSYAVVSDGIWFSYDELYTSETKPKDYEGKVYDYVLELIDINGNVPINSIFRFEDNVIKNICGGTV